MPPTVKIPSKIRREFFNRSVHDVAPELIGATLLVNGAGGVIVEGYSLTEAQMAVVANPVRGEKKIGSVGMPLPDVDVRILDPDDGSTPVAQGEVGEEQVVIDDEDLRVFCFPLHSRDETLVVVRAAGSDSRLGAGLHVPPCGSVVAEGHELGSVSRLRLERPSLDLRELASDGLSASQAL